MLNTQRYILTFLSTIFIFSSGCQKSDLIGLDMDGDSSIKTDTIKRAVEVLTVKDDSVGTNGLAQNAFGYLVDPELGSTQADLAMAFNVPSSSFSFGTGAEIDSVVLVLKYGTEVYGDSTRSNPVTIKAYELDTVFASQAYYNTKNWKRKSDLLSNQQVKTFAKGISFKVLRPADGILDTGVLQAPNLRVQLDKSKLAQILLDSKTDYTSTNTFRQAFKGLYLTMDKPAGSDIGAIPFFDFQSTSNISGIEVYYRNKTTAGNPDTNMVLFPTSSTIAASSIKTRVGSPVVEGNAAVSKVYVQGLGGYRAKVNLEVPLTALKGLASSGNGERKAVSINRAELVIPDISQDSAKFKPAGRLALYRTDIAGLRKAVPDNAIGMDARYLSEIGFGGFRTYNKKTGKHEYRFVITSYIQDLVSGKLKEYETYIAPTRNVFTGAANIAPSATTAARAIIPGKTHPSEQIKLEVIYTRPE
jgi:hypothetical protein